MLQTSVELRAFCDWDGQSREEDEESWLQLLLLTFCFVFRCAEEFPCFGFGVGFGVGFDVGFEDFERRDRGYEGTDMIFVVVDDEKCGIDWKQEVVYIQFSSPF